LAKTFCYDTGIEYIFSKRNTILDFDYDNVYLFGNNLEAVDFVIKNEIKPVLITTGSKNAKDFSKIADISYIRILPYERSIKEVISCGFRYERIIAMHGPFSKLLNYAIIKQFGIKFLITKNSGESGGLKEKITSCKKCNIPVGIVL
jgi:precorrin-6x reductase